MRITYSMMTSRALDDLRSASASLIEAQERASSGKRIRKPSDDITGTGQVMRLRSALSEIDQFERNSKIARTQLTMTESTLQSIASSIGRVKDLATQAGSPLLSESARDSIVAELDEITNALAAAGNTQFAGTYIFAGSESKTKPIAANTVPPGTPPYTYEGDSSTFQVRVAPGVHMAANVTGNAVFNMGSVSVPGSPDVFETIRLLKEEVISGPVDAISARLTDITDNLDNVNNMRSQVGARLNRLDAMDINLADSKVAFQELISKTEDADLAEAILDLQTRQNVYQAAIAATSRLLQVSLSNYLE